MSRRDPMTGMAATILVPLAMLCTVPFLVDVAAQEPQLRNALLNIGVDAAVPPSAEVLDVKGKPSAGSGGVATNYGCGVLPAGKAVTSVSGAATILKAAVSVCYLCDMRSPNTCTITTPESLKGARFLK